MFSSNVVIRTNSLDTQFVKKVEITKINIAKHSHEIIMKMSLHNYRPGGLSGNCLSVSVDVGKIITGHVTVHT